MTPPDSAGNSDHVAGAPRISVIIPVYNGARFLRDAIDSVLAQSYVPWELIVVDDGSTDDSATIVARLPLPAATRLLLARQPNQGPAAARNRGIELATGDLLAFLDADDIWAPEKLQLQVAHLAAHPEAGGVICRQKCTVEPGSTWPQGRNQSYYEEQPAATIFSALLLRRFALEQVGRLDPAFRIGEDTDWFFRARDSGIVIAVTPEVLLHRRFHSDNLSHSTQASPKVMLDIMRASLRRRHRGHE